MPWSRIGRSVPSLRPGRAAAIGLIVHLSVALVWMTSVRAGDMGVERHVPTAPEDASVSGDAGAGTRLNAARPQTRVAEAGSVIASLGRVLIAGTGEVASADGTSAPGVFQGGAHVAAVRAAETEVAHAWAVLREARAEQARVMASPEIVSLATAERELTQAQARATRADVELQRLSLPDSVQLDAAERALWRAEATLRVARSVKPGSDLTQNPVGQAWEIRQAELAVQEALTRRDTLRVGPSAQALAAAHAERESAHAALREALSRLEQFRQDAAARPLEATTAAVLSASAGLMDAEARLHSLRAHTR